MLRVLDARRWVVTEVSGFSRRERTDMDQTTVTLPNQFFTIQSMLTLSGATGATFVIANGCQRAFDFNPRWFALAIALVISLIGAHLSAVTASDYFVGIVNGFLIYCTTVGATTVTGATPPPASAVRALEADGPQRRATRRG